jgi:hypothetical protein
MYTYMCADQQSGQWLVRAIDNHRLGSGARPKTTDTGILPKPVKVAIRTRNKDAQTQNELLRWNKDQNPGIHTENWRILDKQSELKGQRLILQIHRGSFLAIKRSGYKIFADFRREQLTF